MLTRHINSYNARNAEFHCPFQDERTNEKQLRQSRVSARGVADVTLAVVWTNTDVYMSPGSRERDKSHNRIPLAKAWRTTRFGNGAEKVHGDQAGRDGG